MTGALADRTELQLETGEDSEKDPIAGNALETYDILPSETYGTGSTYIHEGIVSKEQTEHWKCSGRGVA